MFENLKLSFQGIWSHKLRSLLTMLGIIIGIAAIIAIVSAIQGTNERIKEKLIGNGDNLVRVQIYQDDWVYQINDYEGVPSGVSVISDKMIKHVRNIDTVVAASAYTMRQESNIYYINSSTSGYVYGIDNSYFSTCRYQIKSGRLFIDKDYSEFRNICILDKKMSENLFGNENPIGKVIEIKNTPLTVVGLVTEMDEYEPIIDTIADYYNYYSSQSSNTGLVFVPNSIWPNIYIFDEPQNMVIKASGTSEMSKAGKAVSDYLNSFISTNNNNSSGGSVFKYKHEDLLKELQKEQDLANETNQMLIWIASISLLVGGIGVMNIMLVSVTERTREIGLKKAIGAKKGRIRAQFLSEAVALTSFGGLIGVGAGIALAKVISNVMKTPFALSIPAMVIAVLFSMAIGIIFGLFPAIQASNLNPIDALRHE
ncbi:MAG: ABC transporter permease [Clostridia bacterium]|nr:ABC transporter permease [Clostridia bacterium]